MSKLLPAGWLNRKDVKLVLKIHLMEKTVEHRAREPCLLLTRKRTDTAFAVRSHSGLGVRASRPILCESLLKSAKQHSPPCSPYKRNLSCHLFHVGSLERCEAILLFGFCGGAVFISVLWFGFAGPGVVNYEDNFLQVRELSSPCNDSSSKSFGSPGA